MKIGTLTFHRAQNYGGVLQSYALVEFLRLHGYDAEIADYHCPNIDSAYKLILTKSLKSFVVSLLYLHKNIKAKKNFSTFRKRYQRISKQVFRKAEDFTDQYDVCIMGSDQVWTLRLIGGFNPVFYGDFSPAIRKVGYAVSIAETKDFTEDERKKMASKVANFSHFSTREDSLRDELQRLTDREVESVLDPSLLLTMDEYAPIIEEPSEKDYVLYYQQEYHPQTKHLVVDIAKQIGAKKVVVVTGFKEKYDFPYSYYDTSNLSVPLFLGLYKNAKAVITSSFHGTAYSLVFRKDFYFVDNKAPDRARNLLKKCGAEDRLIHSTDKIVFSKVDYSKVEPMLNHAREHSINFLLKAIENE